MPEAFNVIFGSRNSNAVYLNGTQSVVYNVNWDAFLPKRFKTFHCQSIFKNEQTSTVLNSNGYVDINLGRVNTYDGQMISNNLGIIYPAAVGTSYFYTSTNNDNNDFTIDYPSNNQITISLVTFAGAELPNTQNYAIYLNMIGVSEEDRLTNVFDSNSLVTRP
jgi:hypothetical protein